MPLNKNIFSFKLNENIQIKLCSSSNCCNKNLKMQQRRIYKLKTWKIVVDIIKLNKKFKNILKYNL